MKPLLNIGLTLLMLLCCGQVHAQFSQPPPVDKPPPVCSLQKAGGGDGQSSRCASDPLATNVVLQCSPYNGILSCVAYTEAFDGAAWVPYNGWPLVHHWAFIVDGQEYYLDPTYADAISFGCGFGHHGYVRVTTAGIATSVSYDHCPRPLTTPSPLSPVIDDRN
jgi:hypothetical protein